LRNGERDERRGDPRSLSCRPDRHGTEPSSHYQSHLFGAQMP
jgi:hypothetical protein